MGAPEGSVGRLSPGERTLGADMIPAVLETELVVVVFEDDVVLLVELFLALLIMRLERCKRGEVAGRDITTPPTVSARPDDPTKRSTPMACTCSTRFTRGPAGD